MFLHFNAQDIVIILTACISYKSYHALSRQGVAGGKQHKHDPERRTRESRAVPAPDANAELVSSLQVIPPFVYTSLNGPFPSLAWRFVCMSYHFF